MGTGDLLQWLRGFLVSSGSVSSTEINYRCENVYPHMMGEFYFLLSNFLSLLHLL